MTKKTSFWTRVYSQLIIGSIDYTKCNTKTVKSLFFDENGKIYWLSDVNILFWLFTSNTTHPIDEYTIDIESL